MAGSQTLRYASFSFSCGPNFPKFDILAIVVNKVEDCMNASANYNIENAIHLYSACAGVAFSPIQTRVVGELYVDC